MRELSTLLYPEGLTRSDQTVLAVILVVFNLGVYGYFFARKVRPHHGR